MVWAVGSAFATHGATDRPPPPALFLSIRMGREPVARPDRSTTRDAVVGIAAVNGLMDLHRPRGPRFGSRPPPLPARSPHTPMALYKYGLVSFAPLGYPRHTAAARSSEETYFGRYVRCSTSFEECETSPPCRCATCFLGELKASPIKILVGSPSGGSAPLSSALVRCVCCSRLPRLSCHATRP